jgi:NAD(P)-dependent dehydrogenase (short-subunit alcohol dehydrogenase family)
LADEDPCRKFAIAVEASIADTDQVQAMVDKALATFWAVCGLVNNAGITWPAMIEAREWAKFGLRCNAVAFGVVETPMTEVLRGEKFRETYFGQNPYATLCRAARGCKGGLFPAFGSCVLHHRTAYFGQW